MWWPATIYNNRLKHLMVTMQWYITTVTDPQLWALSCPKCRSYCRYKQSSVSRHETSISDFLMLIIFKKIFQYLRYLRIQHFNFAYFFNILQLFYAFLGFCCPMTILRTCHWDKQILVPIICSIWYRWSVSDYVTVPCQLSKVTVVSCCQSVHTHKSIYWWSVKLINEDLGSKQ